MKLHWGWAAFLTMLALVCGNFVLAQQASPQRLTLKEAIALALKNNLSVRVARTQVDELEGTRERREASLLPHVSGSLLANRQNVNLGALGFTSIPNIPIPTVIPALKSWRTTSTTRGWRRRWIWFAPRCNWHATAKPCWWRGTPTRPRCSSWRASWG